ncbi:hypothetical protein [Pseudomonas sp. 79_C]|uniref:hypothetical protein n=1 Tax=Pseudomonas sp. 79_C TaxID=2813567 RepID=UPI001A9ECF13|nr:hypothetical protein [Pseudomonas sp. 79_C]
MDDDYSVTGAELNFGHMTLSSVPTRKSAVLKKKKKKKKKKKQLLNSFLKKTHHKTKDQTINN